MRYNNRNKQVAANKQDLRRYMYLKEVGKKFGLNILRNLKLKTYWIFEDAEYLGECKNVDELEHFLNRRAK